MDKHNLKKEIETIKQLRALNKIEEASLLASDLALNFPRSPDLQFLAGTTLYDIGKYESAAFHLELAGSSLMLDKDGYLIFDELSSIMGMLARCDSFSAAKAVWLKNKANINYKDLTFDQVKQTADVLIVIELLDETLIFLNNCFENFDNEEEFIEFLLLMARTFHATDDVESEFETFELALKSYPFNERLHNKLANFLSRLRAYELASDHIKFIQKINPEYTYKSLAQDFFAVSKSGSFDQQEKIKDYWLANPDEPQDSKAPFATLLLTDDPKFLYEDVLKFADWTQLVKGKERRSLKPSRPRLPSDRKIRVGYVSPDFRDHAVCHLITDLIGHHNRNEFEIFGYGISFSDDSEFRQKVVGNFDVFRSLEESKTHEVVRLIEADKLDICVDLCGYTTGMLGTLFNRLNGPLIVNYLGFPGTLGHPQYDYILGDPIVTPEETDQFFSEKVIRLDCCYQSNSPSRVVEDISRESCGVPEDAFVFCNFNTRQKLNRETLKGWEQILIGAPDAVLWLLDPGKAMKHELLSELSMIKNRVFFSPMVPVPKHLGRIRHANLFLDSFPYGAHTTASDAVFSGVPVLARTGSSFQSRVSWSIIHHAGLEDFHANCWGSFIEKASEFYKSFNYDRGMEIKKYLLDFDRPRHPYNIDWTTQEIERAYKQMLTD